MNMIVIPTIPPELLAEAKVWLGYTKNVFDDEIIQTMQACLIDLQNGGVVVIDLTDPIIKQALKLYLKAHFRNDPSAEKFMKSYEFLKYSLELSSDYNQEVDAGG